jgi:hypothetical protein
MPEFWVNGIVAQRNKEPYVQLSNEKGMIAQLSMAEAQSIAMDILVMAARTEMDAMLLKFASEELGHLEMGEVMMHTFREYRAKLDQEKVERGMSDPDTGEKK